MKRFVICEGSAIVSYGVGPERNIEAMRARLPDGRELHELPDDFWGAFSDETHKWDEATQSVVPK